MTHLWMRAEQRPDERRTGLTPEGAAALIAAGMQITIEDSADRCIPTSDYAAAGCAIAPTASWPEAPAEAIILGLKELPDDGTPLRHCHIMFGHAFKGQHSGQALLKRFRAGGGTLYDLEYLTDETGRRLAAFGYWAGYAGAAVSMMTWGAQQAGATCPPLTPFDSQQEMTDTARAALSDTPSVIVIGALGRVGTGAADLCAALGAPVSRWDIAETEHGGPFPELLQHDVFLNCILARPSTPVFVPASAKTAPRRLSVIGDIACDPDSDYNPVPLYDRATTWAAPATRVHPTPPLDVMAIDNLPSLLPAESSADFAAQLLPVLHGLAQIEKGPWARARDLFESHIETL